MPLIMVDEQNIGARPQIENVVEDKTTQGRVLVLHNDEVNTFDFVIESLIKVCKMEAVQAEQITYLVHYKGKCEVKKGNFEYLKPYKEGLLERGLEVTIN